MRDAVGVTTLDLAVETDGTGNAQGLRDEAVTVSNLASGSKLIVTGADTDGTRVNATLTVDAGITGSTTVTLTNKGAAAAAVIDDLDFGTSYTTVTVEQEADKNITITDLSGTKITTLDVGGANSVSGTAIASSTIDIATATIDAATTLNIDSNAGPIKIGTTALAAKKLTTLEVVGDNAVTFGAAASSVTTVLADVNASTHTGGITFGASVDFAGTSDIVLGTGNDTITLVATSNTKTALDMGEKTSDTDKLLITGALDLGVTNIDLSADDQITQINGVVNSSVQKGIENIDLSGMTGTYGAVVTGDSVANIIVGSPNNDVITGGGGADTITPGLGSDTITITDAATDTTAALKVATIQAVIGEGLDTITGFTSGSDKLDIKTTATYVLDSDNGTAVNGIGYGNTNALAAANFSTLANANIAISADIDHETDVVLEIPSTAAISTMTAAGFRAAYKDTGSASYDIEVTTNDQGKFIFIAYDGTGTDADAGLFYVDYSGNDISKNIAAKDTIVHIATLVDIGADNVGSRDRKSVV